MGDWQKRCEINEDVIFFSYTKLKEEDRASEVFIWDLDKTYLDTAFETVKGLIRTVFEKGNQKKNVPGTAELVRVLKQSWSEQNSGSALPLYFITGSPPQLETRIKEKLQFDGLNPKGIFFKDNMQNLRPKRLWRITKQVGFKIQSLLQLRLRLKDDVKQLLWGDDSEYDAVIYSLYSDICSRRLDREELQKILKHYHVVGSQMAKIFDLQEQIPENDPVDKIYINLAVDTDAEYYLKFGRRTLPTYNSFQTSLDFFQDGRVKANHVIDVGRALVDKYDFTMDEIQQSFDDLIRRQVLGEQAVEELLPVFYESGFFKHKFEPSIAPKRISSQKDGRVYELEGTFEPWIPERIDYVHDYR